MHYKVKIIGFTNRLEAINVLRSFYKSLDSEIGLKEIVHYFDEHASKGEYLVRSLSTKCNTTEFFVADAEKLVGLNHSRFGDFREVLKLKIEEHKDEWDIEKEKQDDETKKVNEWFEALPKKDKIMVMKFMDLNCSAPVG